MAVAILSELGYFWNANEMSVKKIWLSDSSKSMTVNYVP